MADSAENPGVHLQELLLGQQAGNLDSATKAHIQTMDLQSKVSIKKYDELDLLQAAAAKELSKSGLPTDLAALRPPALPPVE